MSKHRWARTASRGSAFVALASIASPALHAQEVAPAAPAAPGEVKALNEVTVTGSRIKRDGFVSPTPLTVIKAEDIKASGATTIGELLTNTSQLASTFTLSNSNRFIGTAGLNLLDLRNLGTSRTLVLVNGRRHVGGSAGDTAVDVNTIPIELIERVEIITGGASAIYGADAVTGVVNFILKDSFSGFTARAQSGKADDSDFSRTLFGFTAGRNFDGDRGNAVVSFETTQQDRLVATERKSTRIQTTTIVRPNDPFNTQYIGLNGGNYAITAGGRFTTTNSATTGTPYVFNPDGSVRLQNIGNLADGTRSVAGTNCLNCDYFDSRRHTDLQPDFDTYNFNTVFSYKLTDYARVFTEAKYSRNKVFTLTQPAFNAGNSAPASNSRPIRIASDNAYIGADLRQILTANNLSFINVTRLNFDAGFRGEDISRETSRLVVGVDGTLWDKWDYTLSGNYGRLSERRDNLNNRINDRFFLSTDAVRNSAGQIVCRATIDPNAVVPGTQAANGTGGRRPSQNDINGCVPTTVFGDGRLDPRAAAYFNSRALSSSTVEQGVLSGSFGTNDLIDLWGAGSIGTAAGFEFRNEKSVQTTDSLAATGATFLNVIPGSGGNYNVAEGFAEVDVPLLKDLPLIKSLNANAAARYADYNTIGSTLAYKFTLDWTVTEDALFRGSYSRALRAPNIGELFSPQSQNFFAINDPCSQQFRTTAPNRAVRDANCAALGIPANYVSTVTATRQGVSGGNPDLDRERSTAYTAGLVLTPRYIKNFGVSIDYWSIQIDDVINSTSGQQIANRCVDAAGGINNEFCGRAQRAPGTDPNQPYEIIFITQTLQNLTKLKARGIDLNVNYTTPVPYVGGSLFLTATGTRLLERRFFPFQGENSSEQYNGLLGDPEWDFQFSATYRLKPVRFRANVHLLDDQIIGPTTRASFNANQNQRNPIFTGVKIYTDFNVAYEITKNLEFYTGINNAFEENGPLGQVGNGAGSAIFDNIGRYYYGGINVKFK